MGKINPIRGTNIEGKIEVLIKKGSSVIVSGLIDILSSSSFGLKSFGLQPNIWLNGREWRAPRMRTMTAFFHAKAKAPK
jgi:hypothetical protein